MAWAFSHVPARVDNTQRQQSTEEHGGEEVGRTRAREMEKGEDSG